MSLNNLLGISLEKINFDPKAIQRLIFAAKRNIADAHVENISLENPFDAAYKAVMQLANSALQAHGYRTLTSKPGHHMTMIQTLFLYFAWLADIGETNAEAIARIINRCQEDIIVRKYFLRMATTHTTNSTGTP